MCFGRGISRWLVQTCKLYGGYCCEQVSVCGRRVAGSFCKGSRLESSQRTKRRARAQLNARRSHITLVVLSCRSTLVRAVRLRCCTISFILLLICLAHRLAVHRLGFGLISLRLRLVSLFILLQLVVRYRLDGRRRGGTRRSRRLCRRLLRLLCGHYRLRRFLRQSRSRTHR